jgi:hypothetical protein
LCRLAPFMLRKKTERARAGLEGLHIAVALLSQKFDANDGFRFFGSPKPRIILASFRKCRVEIRNGA